MKVGSEVYILSGTHKDMKGKVIAMSERSLAIKQQRQMMGEETIDDEIDEDAYIGVELNVNQSVVNVRKKRLMLLSQFEKVYKNNK